VSASQPPFKFSSQQRTQVARGLDVDALERLLSRVPVAKREVVRKAFEQPVDSSTALLSVEFGHPEFRALADEVWAPLWESLGKEEFTRRDRQRNIRAKPILLAVGEGVAQDSMKMMIVHRRSGPDMVVLPAADPRLAAVAVEEIMRRRHRDGTTPEKQAIVSMRTSEQELRDSDDPSVLKFASVMAELTTRPLRNLPEIGRARTKLVQGRAAGAPPGWNLARRRLGLPKAPVEQWVEGGNDDE